jgi:hypothetical protein
MESVSDLRHLLTCQMCGGGFTAHRRDARFCGQACIQRAYRLRHQPTIPAAPLPKRLPMSSKVYRCPQCDTRYLGEQRCESCGVFCVLVGPGGECPHCGEPVTVEDLGLPAPPAPRR